MGKGSESAGRGDKKSHASVLKAKALKKKELEKVDGWLDREIMAKAEFSNMLTFWFQAEDGEAQKGVTLDKLREIEDNIKAKYKGIDVEEELKAEILPTTPLTKEQQMAVDWYQSNGYKYINEELRKNKLGSSKLDVQRIDSAFKPLDRDIVVFRGADRFNKKDKAYLSTTTSLDAAKQFARDVERRRGKVQAILIPKGTKVIVPKTWGVQGYEEREVILPRGTDISKFKTKIIMDFNYKNNLHGWTK